VRIADHPGNTWKRGELFGGALGVAAGDDQTSGWVACVNFANGIASLRLGGSGDGTRVDDDDVGVGRFGRGDVTAIAQLALEGSAIGLRGSTAELLDVKGAHLALWSAPRKDATDFRGTTL
jgi:hypothetical protein